MFPSAPGQAITEGPLVLVKCEGENACGLLQLVHSYDLGEMYGENYGYRSGLNPSMVRHLHGKLTRILGIVTLSDKPIVLDIGSNDGTTLAGYPEGSCRGIGMDPTAAKFREYYPKDVTVIADFFSAKRFNEAFPGQRARVETSFSMFYDLDAPSNSCGKSGRYWRRKGFGSSSKVTCHSCSSAIPTTRYATSISNTMR